MTGAVWPIQVKRVESVASSRRSRGGSPTSADTRAARQGRRQKMLNRQKLQIERPLFPSAEVEDEYLTVREVAVLLRLPQKSCYSILGDIALELAPRTLRWRKSDVLAWIDT